MRLMRCGSSIKKETIKTTSALDILQIRPLDNEEEKKLRELLESYSEGKYRGKDWRRTSRFYSREIMRRPDIYNPTIIEKKKAKNREVHLAFIDLRKAYDLSLIHI